MVDPLLTRLEVAELLGVPTKTLATWAARGEGPIYYRYGKHARYRPHDVDAWLKTRQIDPTERYR